MSLPKNYELPASEKKVSDGYLNKFEEGDTRIRILSDIQTGFEWWIDPEGINIGSRKIQKGDKPVRVKTLKEAVSAKESGEYKHFWVMVVWNYNSSKIQILQIRQSGIQRGIEVYENDEDWGDSKQYDIVIKRTGTGFETTKYEVVAKPAKPVEKSILKAYHEENIDLEVWFAGGNPFGALQKSERDLIDESVEEVTDVSEQVPF